jgi:hypothetical protein
MTISFHNYRIIRHYTTLAFEFVIKPKKKKTQILKKELLSPQIQQQVNYISHSRQTDNNKNKISQQV